MSPCLNLLSCVQVQYIHTYIYTYIHTYIHIYIHICIRIVIHSVSTGAEIQCTPSVVTHSAIVYGHRWVAVGYCSGTCSVRRGDRETPPTLCLDVHTTIRHCLRHAQWIYIHNMAAPERNHLSWLYHHLRHPLRAGLILVEASDIIQLWASPLIKVWQYNTWNALRWLKYAMEQYSMSTRDCHMYSGTIHTEPTSRQEWFKHCSYNQHVGFSSHFR